MNVLKDLQDAPMSRFQVFAISVALVLLLMDGYDVAVMAFAAPELSEQWNISASALGYLLSASLFGMAAGSIVLAPLSDKIGRRPLTMICLTIITLGLLGSVFSVNVATLFIARVVTGLGIGGMVANLNVLVSELSSTKRRGLAMGIYAAGFPIGATLCGFIARPMIPAFGWQSVFLVGAVVTFAMLLLSFRYLPESLDFLLTKRPPNALERVNSILTSVGQPTLKALPDIETAEVRDGGAREVLSKPLIVQTLLLWLGYGTLTAGYYFANTWLPKIMTTVTGDANTGVTLGTIANFGGIIGCFLFGALTVYMPVRRLLIGTLAAAAITFAVFSTILGNTTAAMVVAALLGLLTTAGIVGFYTVPQDVYSPKARATGSGWMIGAGRLVSIASPIIVGYLIAADWTPGSLFVIYTIPLLIAAVSVIGLGVASRRTCHPNTSSAVEMTVSS